MLDLQPGTLSVYVGINDTWRRYKTNEPTSAEHFETVYRSMLEEARALWQPRMVLVEPFVVPVSEAQERWGARISTRSARWSRRSRPSSRRRSCRSTRS